MLKPTIGYTTRDGMLNLLQLSICFSIWLAGGRPLRLKPSTPRYDETIDGLVIGGGTDLYPALYEGLPKQNYKYDQARDEMEITWLKKAEQSDVPVLGICRGAQLINIQRGGSLHVDVGKAYEDAQYPSHFLAKVFFRKMIFLESNSVLQKCLGQDKARVNSMHTQAIDRLGESLKVSSKEKNGVVQSIEDASREFFIGVQFHPEVLIYRRRFRRIFRQMITAASSS